MEIKCGGNGDQHWNLGFPMLRSPDSAKKLKGEELKKTRRAEASTCIQKGSGAGHGGTTFNVRMRQVDSVSSRLDWCT